jgi:hypothetical protein
MFKPSPLQLESITKIGQGPILFLFTIFFLTLSIENSIISVAAEERKNGSSLAAGASSETRQPAPPLRRLGSWILGF